MLGRRVRKRPVLGARGREGTTWLLAKASNKSRALLWGDLTLGKLSAPHTNSELGSPKFPLAAVPGSCIPALVCAVWFWKALLTGGFLW